MSGDKRPLSVLVLAYTPGGEILLLERLRQPGFWQSVTGSLEIGEDHRSAAIREFKEETGIPVCAEHLLDSGIENRFEILPLWRDRYPAGIVHNVERVFLIELAEAISIQLAPDEHRNSIWLPWQEAADRVFSWTNRDAILRLAIKRDWIPSF